MITCLGQSDTAAISGYVLDPSGAAVASARVRLTNEQTGATRAIQSNDSGFYQVTSLIPGQYTLLVEAPGFEGYSSQHNKLDPSVSLRVDARLTVGKTGEVVNVTADAAILQTESATVGKLISGEQVSNLQLNGRNPFYLAQLQPGVRRGNSISNFSFGVDNNIAINGARRDDNLVVIDGAIATRTRGNGTSVGVADVDAVQEVQVLTANYLPEYGRSSGGQIRIITKSGGRAFHGNAYEYLRNSALNANTWARNAAAGTALQKAPAPFRFNQFGYNFSGPIYVPNVFNRDKSKFFFFFGQEYLRFRQDSTSFQRVPTVAMRNGDFSELLNPSNIFYGRSVVIRDPATGNPYPNNVIPRNQLSPNGIGLLNTYPLPNASQGANNWAAAQSAPVDQRKDSGSFDWLPAERHYVRFRILAYEFISVTPFQGNFNLLPQVQARPNRTGSLNYTWTVTPTLVNEVLLSGSDDRVRTSGDFSSGLANRTRYGVNYPYLFPGTKEIANKIATTNFSGVIGTVDGLPYPSRSEGIIMNVSDNLTKIWGNHTIKGGFLWERSGQNDFDQININTLVPGSTNNQNGQFLFTDGRTAGTSGSALANAALGLFDTYGEIGQRSYTLYRGHMYEWFAQDSWRVNPKLKIEYGLRYSIIQPYYAGWGNIAVFDPQYYNPAAAPTVDPRTGFTSGGVPFNGVVIPGSKFPKSAFGRIPGADTGLYNGLFRNTSPSYSKIDFSDFQPRAGFAYSVTNKTVIRGGGGRFVTRQGISDSVLLGGNPPFQPTATVSFGSVDNPGGRGSNSFPLAVTSEVRDLRNPEAWTWNATIEHQLTSSSLITVGYVGRRGLHLPRERNLNQLAPGTTQANPGINTDSLRPFQGYSALRQLEYAGRSLYNGLQVNLTRRFSKGLLFGVAYTYSKSNDYGSTARDLLFDARSANGFYGPSDFDTRHVLVVNYVYDVPIFRNRSEWTGKLLGGWTLSGTTQVQTGAPQTVATTIDYAGVGPGSGFQPWNLNGPVTLSHDFSPSSASTRYWFNVINPDGSAVFTQPAAGTFTTQQNRNRVFGPGFQSWNAALQKSFSITETQGLLFKFEAFNFINHPNLDNPNVNPTNRATFGKVLGKGGTYASDRQLQLSLRYRF